MQFENTTYLYLLAAIPVIAALFYIYIVWRKRAIQKLGDERLIHQLMDRNSLKRKILKTAILALAFSSLTIGIANLRSGSKKEKAKGESSEIIICFDVSNSMLAEDVKPDRLTQAKITASQIIEKIAGNKIGLIVFAGKSYVQMPLSNDARAALMYLNTINTGMVPTQGTAIGNTIETAINEFEEGGENDNDIGKSIIIITDGESHDENAIEMAKKAADENIQIITIGIGTTTGAPIPYKRGNVTQGFKKDKQGNIVLTRLNEKMLEEIAENTNGFYINASKGRQLIQKVNDAVEKLDKTENQTFEYTEYANHFQIFLMFGLILMTVEFFISDKKSLWLKKINLFGTPSNKEK